MIIKRRGKNQENDIKILRQNENLPLQSSVTCPGVSELVCSCLIAELARVSCGVGAGVSGKMVASW